MQYVFKYKDNILEVDKEIARHTVSESHLLETCPRTTSNTIMMAHKQEVLRDMGTVLLGEGRASTHRLEKGDLFLTSRFESLASPESTIRSDFQLWETWDTAE